MNEDGTLRFRPRNKREESKPNKKVIELIRRGKAVPVCPEELGGLPTLRVACYLDGDRIIGKDGRDYTELHRILYKR